MEKYESKQARINKPAWMVYNTLSDFSHFTPIIADKVENWEATPDNCSFTVKGFKVGLRITERRENELIKVEGEDGTPFEFTLWFQMKEAAQDDTRIRLVLAVKLNMMMKMMLGGKLQEGVDNIAEKIAEAFNNAPAGFDPGSFVTQG